MRKSKEEEKSKYDNIDAEEIEMGRNELLTLFKRRGSAQRK